MIYLDNNATTCLDPEVFASCQPLLQNLVGNPSSVHYFGQQAKELLTDALKRSSRFFNVRADELTFTSGATEALNFLIHTVPQRGHVITSSIEHSAILEPLKSSFSDVTYIDPPVGKGAVDPMQIRNALQSKTSMIILSAANNETGIQIDLNEIATIAERAGVPFVIDGVAYLGKAPFLLPNGVTAACFSGHKIHGPLGVGLAILKRSIKGRPLILGGPQQRGLRAGTENLPAIVGFVKALELLSDRWIEQMRHLRDLFEEGIVQNLSDVVIHGKEEPRICNTSNIAFLGVDGETLLMTLDLSGVASSHGSACSSGTLGISKVLLNMGLKPHVVRSSLRFSLSRFTTREEIENSVAIITECVKRLRV